MDENKWEWRYVYGDTVRELDNKADLQINVDAKQWLLEQSDCTSRIYEPTDKRDSHWSFSVSMYGSDSVSLQGQAENLEYAKVAVRNYTEALRLVSKVGHWIEI